ncbi:NADAR family protein [Aspergillus undulatus]|uniref:NADAR family protein n=1 Tax=Aspergillus undulatus TaxID=1810928 RepID=UPI003CCE4238
MPRDKTPTKPETSTSDHLANPDIRVTDTHIYFLRGILSNWYASPVLFSGARALELCLAHLDALNIPHPAENEITLSVSISVTVLAALNRQQHRPSRNQLWESALCQIMRASSLKAQESLGRKVPNFNEDLWNKASRAIVVAGCVARAEVDADLKQLYLASGKRVFVEGSSTDCIWGVGLEESGDSG